MKIFQTYILDTASIVSYEIAKDAAEKTGMIYQTDYRANCFKCYRIVMQSTTIENNEVLNLVMLATTAHQQQAEFARKLSEKLAKIA